jgi:hypothetical protein
VSGQRSDHLEHRLRPLDVSFEHALAGHERNARRCNSSRNTGLGRWPITMPAACRELDHRAVLRNDGVETGQVSADGVEIEQSASRDQDHDDATLPYLPDRLAYRGIEHSGRRDRAVVVERQRGGFHNPVITETTAPLTLKAS